MFTTILFFLFLAALGAALYFGFELKDQKDANREIKAELFNAQLALDKLTVKPAPKKRATRKPAAKKTASKTKK